jgi:acetate kinase
MDQKIVLSINAGSSSIKAAAYRLLPGESPQKLATIEIDNLGSPSVTTKYDTVQPKNDRQKDKDSEDDSKSDFDGSNLEEVFDHIVNHLAGDHGPVEIQTTKDIHFVAHRIVHGGEIQSPRVLDKGLFEYLEELSDLAPL